MAKNGCDGTEVAHLNTVFSCSWMCLRDSTGNIDGVSLYKRMEMDITQANRTQDLNSDIKRHIWNFRL
jgi:hypothetical protein